MDNQDDIGQKLDPELTFDLQTDPDVTEEVHTSNDDESESDSFDILPEIPDGEDAQGHEGTDAVIPKKETEKLGGDPDSVENFGEQGSNKDPPVGQSQLDLQTEVKSPGQEVKEDQSKNSEEEVTEEAEEEDGHDWSHLTFTIWDTSGHHVNAARFQGSEFSPSLADPSFHQAVEDVLEKRDRGQSSSKVANSGCVVIWKRLYLPPSVSEIESDESGSGYSDYTDDETEVDPKNIKVIYRGLYKGDIAEFQRALNITKIWTGKAVKAAVRVEKMARYCGLVKLREQASAILRQLKFRVKVKSNPTAQVTNLSSKTGANWQRVLRNRGQSKEKVNMICGCISITVTLTVIVLLVLLYQILRDIAVEHGKTLVRNSIVASSSSEFAADRDRRNVEELGGRKPNPNPNPNQALAESQPQCPKGIKSPDRKVEQPGRTSEKEKEFPGNDWSHLTFSICDRSSQSWRHLQVEGSEFRPDLADPSFRRAVTEVLKKRDRGQSSSKVTDSGVIVMWKSLESAVMDDGDLDEDYDVRPNNIKVVCPDLEVGDLGEFRYVKFMEKWNRKAVKAAIRIEKMAHQFGLVKLGQEVSSILREFHYNPGRKHLRINV